MNSKTQLGILSSTNCALHFQCDSLSNKHTYTPNLTREKKELFTTLEKKSIYSPAARKKGSGRNTTATQREKESARIEETANELPNDGEGASNHGNTASYDGNRSFTVAVEAVSV
ncbi:hypothetical protein HN873_051704 [Arachis hypogaea]